MEYNIFVGRWNFVVWASALKWKIKESFRTHTFQSCLFIFFLFYFFFEWSDIDSNLFNFQHFKRYIMKVLKDVKESVQWIIRLLRCGKCKRAQNQIFHQCLHPLSLLNIRKENKIEITHLDGLDINMICNCVESAAKFVLKL